MSSLHPLLSRRLARVALVLSLVAPCSAFAGGGKLLLTGGVGTVDGAGGGGLTPWAMTGSYASADQWGGTALMTRAETQDYALTVSGVAFTWHDRVEVSVAEQDFDTRNNLAPLGLGGLHLKLRSLGLKWRLAGDAVLDTDRALPQLAAGLMLKTLDAGALGPTLTGPLGADDQGLELYVSATKLFLASGILVNGTLRLSNANQGGLLGFGGADSDARRLLPEVSVAWLPRRDLAVGLEYRVKPNHLQRSVLGDGALAEDDWWDLFAAWTPNKHLSVTVAWVNLGRIAPAVQPRRQQGASLSLQAAY